MGSTCLVLWEDGDGGGVGTHGWLDLDVDPDTVLNLKLACSSLDPRADFGTTVCQKAES